MVGSSLLLRKIMGWLLACLAFIVAVLISAQPKFFQYFAPFEHLHLIVLMIIMMLRAEKFPLWLLLLAGLLVDALHQRLLGTSSLLFLILIPYVQLYLQSAVRFSLKHIWLAFCGFYLVYMLGLTIIDALFFGRDWSMLVLFSNSIMTLILFPFLFALVVHLFGLRKPNAMTPL